MMRYADSTARTLSLAFTLAASVFLTASQSPQESSGVSPWGWVIIILIFLLLVILIWWYFRSSRHTPVPPPAVVVTQAPPGAAPIEPDDLTIIEGIGPKIAATLLAAGINTFSQLAASDPARLNEILDEANLRLADPSTWPEQARLAAAGDREALQALQDSLKRGRVA